MYSYTKATVKNILDMKLHDCTDEQRKVMVWEVLTSPNNVLVLRKNDEPLGAVSILKSTNGLELSVYSLTTDVRSLYLGSAWAVNNIDEHILLKNVYLKTSTKFGEYLLNLLDRTGRYTIVPDGEGVRVTHDRT
jgi:hypothetical protein